jgi:transposase-like protein
MRTVLHKSVRDMNEHIIVALRPQNIFAIRLGVRRRRSWSDAAKVRIVAESFASGAVVSHVARRYGISPQQLSTWRKAARTGVLSVLDDTASQAEPKTTQQRYDDLAPALEGADKITLAQSGFPSSHQARAALACPGPRQKFVEARGRPEIDELGQHVGEISLRIDAAEFAALDERGDAGPILGAMIMAGEECILAIENNLAVILPMSGRMSWSIIVGTRCMGRACGVFGPSGGHRVISYKWSCRPAP